MLSITTRPVLTILYILSWILFVGVSIEAGSFITNAVFALVNPSIVKYLWHEVDLSDLITYNQGYFFVILVIMSIVAVMRALLFYLIIKILHDKKLDLAQPFNKEVRRFITNIAYIALAIGLFCWSGVKYTAWLVGQGVKMPDTHYLRLGGADVSLFMAVVLFVIAQMMKRGIEIQTENDLTV